MLQLARLYVLYSLNTLRSPGSSDNKTKAALPSQSSMSIGPLPGFCPYLTLFLHGLYSEWFHSPGSDYSRCGNAAKIFTSSVELFLETHTHIHNYLMVISLHKRVLLSAGWCRREWGDWGRYILVSKMS